MLCIVLSKILSRTALVIYYCGQIDDFYMYRPRLLTDALLLGQTWWFFHKVGACLGICTDLSETRASVPLTSRESVHCVPVIAGWIELVERYPTIYQRSQTRTVLTQEWYKTTALGDVVRSRRRDGVTEAFRSST